MSVPVAFETQRSEEAVRDGKLGNPSAGDVDLKNGAGHRFLISRKDAKIAKEKSPFLICVLCVLASLHEPARF